MSLSVFEVLVYLSSKLKIPRQNGREHLSLLIKEIVTSKSVLHRTTAGLILLPFKSVNGNGIKTMVPFFINTLPLNRL